MGFYWYSCVYLGRLLTQESYDRLRSDTPKSILDDWITNMYDPRGRYVLHPPGCLIQLGTIDPVLEDHEINRGFVEMSELEKNLSLQQLHDVSVENIDRLKEFIRIASGPKDVIDYKIYILEAEWSTLDGDICNKRVVRNIQVTGNVTTDNSTNIQLDMADLVKCRVFNITGRRDTGKSRMARYIADYIADYLEPTSTSIREVSGMDGLGKDADFVWDNVVQGMHSDDKSVIIFDNCRLDKRHCKPTIRFAMDTKSTVIFVDQYPVCDRTKVTNVNFLVKVKSGGDAKTVYERYARGAFTSFEAFTKVLDLAKYDCMVIFDDDRVRWCNVTDFGVIEGFEFREK